MNSPMEIVQNPPSAVATTAEQEEEVDSNPCAASPSPSISGPLPLVDDRVLVSALFGHMIRMLEKRCLSFTDGPVPIPLDDSFLMENVKRIHICETDELVSNHGVLLFWQVRPVVHVYQLCEDGAGEEISGDEMLSSFNEWVLPAKEYDGLWERYSSCQLVEVNAHSLFSKWFSESGKLVAKLFQKIQEMVEEDNLVFVLIDEVESLAAARQAALSGSEPSDSIRVVNALLTQMDRLKSSPNVIILTTSNITAAIDIAFVDRADIKAYVGPPTLQARFEILRSCLEELLRTGILIYPKEQDFFKLPSFSTSKERLHHCELQESEGQLRLLKQLIEAAEVSEGLSGRALRKLPFLAHAALSNPNCCDLCKFLNTLIETARRELSESHA
ncbi:hypothetical protein QJS04_geneDACA004304 [Acorus gramineus]|uniref:Pachytene checkpoint protein 2 homolog n=1 Tax=Acorus gramineus TaxID=55184 RepID=A0AAV9B1V3_ACOGR|nr:hypothetical protein QJS04_geneDACA004304 [Acorus gramineus]